MGALDIQRWLAVIVLIGIAGYKYSTFHRSPGVDRYHAQVRASAADVPTQIGAWVGEETPLPARQLTVLHPNLLFSKKFVNIENGTNAGVLIVHCADAHLMVGHYPLRCYPAEGWKLEGQAARDWSAGNLQITGTEYHFSKDEMLGGSRGQRNIVVANFLLRPGGLVLRDMGGMSKSIIGAEGQATGAGQVQIYFDASVDAGQRDAAIVSLTTGLRPVIDAILSKPIP